MSASFFWYDLETSGVNPRQDRVMQFAGQRTDMDLNQIGEPINVLIKLTEDILPNPDAILITGITPQQTISEGLTEVEFLKLFYEEVATPGTIFVGFNSVRFDDEFMRCMHYRNFYDPYQWQWKDDRSRWDLLDVVRMTRALRPEGIAWPVTPEGVPTNRLELLTAANELDHQQAHDALNDVLASIALARLIRDKQPKLFDWLLAIRDKKNVQKLVNTGDPFVYSSGKYANEFEKTTVAVQLLAHPKRSASLVYDLRHDPTEFLELSAGELAECWRWNKDPDAPKRLPIKTLRYNVCPAVAPLNVLDAASQKRLQLDLSIIGRNHDSLLAAKSFPAKITEALELLDASQDDTRQISDHVDTQLYDGFFDDHDAKLQSVVRAAEPNDLSDIAEDFHDTRLRQMLPLYKARNFPRKLTDDERQAWETYRYKQLMEGGKSGLLGKYMHRLQELLEAKAGNAYLLEELQLYAESIMPVLDTTDE